MPTNGHETKYGKITIVWAILRNHFFVISNKNNPKSTDTTVPKSMHRTFMTIEFVIILSATDEFIKYSKF